MADLSAVKEKLGDLPYMRLDQAEWLTAFITNFRLKRILEIGTFHGVSACYLGAIVQTLGGTVATVDLP